MELAAGCPRRGNRSSWPTRSPRWNSPLRLLFPSAWQSQDAPRRSHIAARREHYRTASPSSKPRDRRWCRWWRLIAGVITRYIRRQPTWMTITWPPCGDGSSRFARCVRSTSHPTKFSRNMTVVAWSSRSKRGHGWNISEPVFQMFFPAFDVPFERSTAQIWRQWTQRLTCVRDVRIVRDFHQQARCEALIVAEPVV